MSLADGLDYVVLLLQAGLLVVWSIHQHGEGVRTGRHLWIRWVSLDLLYVPRSAGLRSGF